MAKMSGLCHLSSRIQRNGTHPAHVFLDLFGTLIYPALPIHIRYNQIAHANGFGDFKLSAKNFKTAFKKTNKEFPNYGKNAWVTDNQEKHVRMLPKDWWLKVVKGTFEDSLNAQESLPRPKLSEIEKISELIYEEFLTNEDEKIYKNYEDTLDFINYLTTEKIGFSILTNSDPKILNALPPSLKELLFSKDQINSQFQAFTSWDIGFSKPDQRIWDSAISQLNLNKSKDRLIHVGDDFQEDFLGAKSAGIGSIWLDRQDNHQKISKPINNEIANHQFKAHERIHSLNELIGFL
ncbi:uncharacterized protein PGTG_03520 [Puccinia graminis f. sp. tritici CRL 75-36-700-3]|uniref:Haloacid dehalogenase-like hydrolase domain-containing protein 3 n=1 Tax=Puccinia graminis f. sp. tritici (strain CRL 75-36-700-3 / race SCCL) TaxID=418459 RepID=E3JZT9_PUCGT|nr:uncharacterized protein PGTG_03520 [Puccinia graminis f. sp. tritici CRL 75-36-700-3]EFP77564.2 hypothetical protein PGTG_03520 [Puccinia graminis f. sp. tritici CRL 75-36-700-3]